MKRFLIACTLFVLISPGVWPGVVIEMEASEPGAASGMPIDTIYAQGEMLRMDSQAERSGPMSILFRDETLWMVNHEAKSCQMIDKEGIEQLSAQLGGVMRQMEAELSKLPPEQRAMMEEMLKRQMPAGMAGMGKPGPTRRIEVGAVEQVGDYSCRLHTLFAGEEKVWEQCAAEEGLSGAASEAMGAFRALSRFVEQLQESIQQGPFSEMVKTPFSDMDEVSGFPIRVRTFDNGRVASETTLKSIISKDLDAAIFALPDGYTIQNLADEMKRGR